MISKLAEAEKELAGLHAKIKAAGKPPHTDHWHQSLYEAEKKVVDARKESLSPMVAIKRSLLEECVRADEAGKYPGGWIAEEMRAALSKPLQREYTLHMGEATKVFGALKTAHISSKVLDAELGPIGATAVETWATEIGVTLEMRESMGGCTLIVRSIASAASTENGVLDWLIKNASGTLGVPGGWIDFSDKEALLQDLENLSRKAATNDQ